MNTQIVIARYKENIEWLNHIKLQNQYISIYNKYYKDEGNFLPNVGREAHTYLHYIIENYDNLKEYTVFLQGDPVPHNPQIINQINFFLNNYSKFTDNFIPLGYIAKEGLNGTQDPRHPFGLPMYYFANLLFDRLNLDSIVCTYGAQFIVNQKAILNRPKSFYNFLIKFVLTEEHPLEAYILERLWGYIFNTSVNLNNKYQLFL